MGVESYLHKYAKIVVASWLRKKIRIGPKFKGLSNIPLELEFPKKKPMYNVYTEFPVCKSLIDDKIIGIDVEWDKYIDEHDLQSNVRSKTKIPTIYELKDMNDKFKLLSIFDIGIVDKGKLKYIFEIEHTHACTPRKIKFINNHKLIGYELSAQKVMEQVKLPYAIDINTSWNIN